MVAAMENGLSKLLQPIVAEEAKTHVISILHHHRQPVPLSNLSSGEFQVAEDLQSDRDLIILPADKFKDHLTLIMDHFVYEERVHGLLAYCNALQTSPTESDSNTWVLDD